MGCLLLECVLAKDDFRKACFHVHVSESKHIIFLNQSTLFFYFFVYTWEGGQVQGDKMLMGATHEGGPYFDRLYHKLKVLLLLSCNYMMQLVGYESIKTH